MNFGNEKTEKGKILPESTQQIKVRAGARISVLLPFDLLRSAGSLGFCTGVLGAHESSGNYQPMMPFSDVNNHLLTSWVWESQSKDFLLQAILNQSTRMVPGCLRMQAAAH